MVLGSPAIPTPNQIELRAIQTAISNARQRIEALERAVNTNTDTAGAANVAAKTQSNGLLALINALTVRVAALEAEIVTADSGDLQISARAFMPHVPLMPDPLPQETATILAGQIFGD